MAYCVLFLSLSLPSSKFCVSALLVCLSCVCLRSLPAAFIYVCCICLPVSVIEFELWRPGSYFTPLCLLLPFDVVVVIIIAFPQSMHFLIPCERLGSLTEVDETNPKSPLCCFRCVSCRVPFFLDAPSMRTVPINIHCADAQRLDALWPSTLTTFFFSFPTLDGRILQEHPLAPSPGGFLRFEPKSRGGFL